MVPKKNTLVVNFLSGPGAGKSTLCAALFARLKFLGIDCEMSLEYAKDVVWEESLKKLDNQIYIFGKQLHRLQRLNHKVRVVITDAPLIHSAIYCKPGNDTFIKLILEEHNKFQNINYFINRRKNYDSNGRVQTLEEAKVVDDRILKYLADNKVVYNTIEGDPDVIDSILPYILRCVVTDDAITKIKTQHENI